MARTNFFMVQKNELMCRAFGGGWQPAGETAMDESRSGLIGASHPIPAGTPCF